MELQFGSSEYLMIAIKTGIVTGVIALAVSLCPPHPTPREITFSFFYCRLQVMIVNFCVPAQSSF